MRFQEKKVALEEKIVLETAEKTLGRFINQNLEVFLKERRQKKQEYKGIILYTMFPIICKYLTETVEKSLLSELVFDIRSLNSNWKSANLRTK